MAGLIVTSWGRLVRHDPKLLLILLASLLGAWLLMYFSMVLLGSLAFGRVMFSTSRIARTITVRRILGTRSTRLETQVAQTVAAVAMAAAKPAQRLTYQKATAAPSMGKIADCKGQSDRCLPRNYS